MFYRLERTKLLILVVCFFGLAMLTQSVCSEEILVDDYQNGLSPKWKERIFKGKTQYEVVEEDGRLCIKATSNSSASGLYFEVDYDLRDYPILTWSWKIDRVISKGDASKKVGDDYAARVYVVFPSWNFWNPKAISYIWANKLPRGKTVPSPFSKNTFMVALESGHERVQGWVQEKRNVLEDYRRLFGKDPPRAGGVAIMTDTDNTGAKATAWYGPIRMLSDKKKGSGL
jgi:hypothetical protein